MAAFLLDVIADLFSQMLWDWGLGGRRRSKQKKRVNVYLPRPKGQLQQRRKHHTRLLIQIVYRSE